MTRAWLPRPASAPARGGWPRARRLAAGLGLTCLVAGCSPLGLARGDYWRGTSTGDTGTCPPFEFELAIEDGRIGGSATSEFTWGTVLWQARGQVGSDRQVTIETRTEDPRVTPARLAWTGSYNLILWEITQAPDPACPSPRVAKLQRR